jgi:hypothetical protein
MDGEARLKKRTGIPGLRAVTECQCLAVWIRLLLGVFYPLPRACLPGNLYV